MHQACPAWLVGAHQPLPRLCMITLITLITPRQSFSIMALFVDYGRTGQPQFITAQAALTMPGPAAISPSSRLFSQHVRPTLTPSNSPTVPSLARSTVHSKLQQSPLANRSRTSLLLSFPCTAVYLHFFGFGKPCHTLHVPHSLVTVAQTWPSIAPIDISSTTPQNNLSLCLHVKYS